MSIRFQVTLVATGLIIACGPSSEPSAVTDQPEALVDHELWEPVGAEDDYFEDRPDLVDCPQSGYGVEDGFFEVTTDACDYGTFEQPVLIGATRAEKIRLLFWHSPLSASEPAEAHVALGINGQVLWEQYISIPNDAIVYDETISVLEDFEKGDSLHYHLHNHGNNSWRLGLIEKPVE
jgi:hypothetical protein